MNNHTDYIIHDRDAWRKEAYHEDEYDYERAHDNRYYDYSDFDPEDDNDFDLE